MSIGKDMTKIVLDVKILVDDLRAVGFNYGLSGTPDEYEVITQMFLYKFLNDKFTYELKQKFPEFNKNGWEKDYSAKTGDEILDIFDILDPDVPRFEPDQLITTLWNKSRSNDFDEILEKALIDLSVLNENVFFTQNTSREKLLLFDGLKRIKLDQGKRADFTRALVDKLTKFSFEETFGANYDFFATIFEYLIKGYNTAGGEDYSEYYTPHAIAEIMAELLVDDDKINDGSYRNIECYDPSAGTGTLLMGISNKIGRKRCRIYSQDISNKSSNLIKLNLILNGLVSSLDNIICGNTLADPFHKNNDGSLKTFDFVVSNPPFRGDMSEYRDKIAAQTTRFWAGVPKIPNNPKSKPKMSIYTCFIQHVINSLKPGVGRGAIVVPAGFLSATNSVEGAVLKTIIDSRVITGCVAMPPNIFATTGTNVAVLFFDMAKKTDTVILVNATKMGEDYNDGKSKKKRLRDYEIKKIVEAYKKRLTIDDFSITVDYETLVQKKSLIAGRYFKPEFEYKVDDSFDLHQAIKDLEILFAKSDELQNHIMDVLKQIDAGE